MSKYIHSIVAKLIRQVQRCSPVRCQDCLPGRRPHPNMALV